MGAVQDKFRNVGLSQRTQLEGVEHTPKEHVVEVVVVLQSGQESVSFEPDQLSIRNLVELRGEVIERAGVSAQHAALPGAVALDHVQLLQ